MSQNKQPAKKVTVEVLPPLEEVKPKAKTRKQTMHDLTMQCMQAELEVWSSL